MKAIPKKLPSLCHYSQTYISVVWGWCCLLRNLLFNPTMPLLILARTSQTFPTALPTPFPSPYLIISFTPCSSCIMPYAMPPATMPAFPSLLLPHACLPAMPPWRHGCALCHTGVRLGGGRRAGWRAWRTGLTRIPHGQPLLFAAALLNLKLIIKTSL